jgi:hypothetical protein
MCKGAGLSLKLEYIKRALRQIHLRFAAGDKKFMQPPAAYHNVIFSANLQPQCRVKVLAELSSVRAAAGCERVREPSSQKVRARESLLYKSTADAHDVLPERV